MHLKTLAIHELHYHFYLVYHGKLAKLSSINEQGGTKFMQGFNDEKSKSTPWNGCKRQKGIKRFD